MPQIEEMRHVLGKRVKVKCVRSGDVIVGDLYFVGTNEYFPTWGLTCTVARRPGIHLNSVADIEELEPLIEVVRWKD